MASHRERFSSGGTLIEGKKGDGIFVFDRRRGDSAEVSLQFDELTNFKTFRDKICQIFNIADNLTYVITTTSREEIKDDETWGYVEAGDTLYILQSVTQELTAQAHERVNYLPHYDTIVKGGMYEYYASEGQNPLPYAIAELIDNALAATAENIGPRNIEIRLHLDESNPSRNMVIVLDNGKGMTSPQLNNWAIYRLSKFIRRKRKGHGNDGEASLLPTAPRSLNSDISYFGVGGKQAIFFIGNSTRMITRAHGSKDVHEMMISKDDFEQKERNHEAIYSGYIRNRKPGDTSHVVNEDDFLKAVIEEEAGKDSFTTVVINGINPTHVPYLKMYMTQWTRQLAHIYHYYIHGPNGNIDRDTPTSKQPGDMKTIDIMPDEWFSKINIEVKVYIGSSKQPRVINLRDINDDMPTQFIRTAANTFEFKATVEYTGIVEGVLRYHPFLYDHETYPSDANDLRAEADPEDDHDYAASDVRPARGRRPIFECYWNGRLIPYSFIDEFDWCSVPKKNKGVPLDCYNRVSGVLWTNDKFQVSTNKLTFIDLELRLRDKNTTYGRILGKNDVSKGQQAARRLQEYAVVLEKRTDIGREFNAWLKECHERCDKQVKFSQYSGSITRPELVKHRQSPWSVYGQIEWDGKVFKKGIMVRIIKTIPVTYGTIHHFLLHGNHEGDVFATGGDITIIQEPRSLYNEVKTFPLSKLDRTANHTLITKYIDDEVSKLPNKLVVSWPEGDEVTHGEKRPAGQTIGAIKVEIANRRGEFINKMPGGAGGTSRKLLVELKVIWHSCNGDEVIAQHISQHGRSWPYWFRKMENVKNLGPHTILLQAVLNESGASMFAGKELPCSAVRFTVIEAEPEKFSVGLLEGPFRVGVAFQIPLEFQDEFGHTTKPTSTLKPTLHASDLELTYGDAVIEGSHLILKDIIASGKVSTSTGMNVQLVVTIPGLPDDSQTLKIRLLPGLPHTLVVTPDTEVTVENGNMPSFEVEVRDCAGNFTTQPRLQVMCKFVGAPGLPAYTVDCSSEGCGVLSGAPLLLKKMNGEQTLTARIEIPGFKAVGVVERSVKMLPSSQAASITVTYLKDEKTDVSIKSGQDISAVAGELLCGIKFQIMDEAGRMKPCDKALASKMKVNWTPKLSKDLLMAGSLPDVRAPTTLQDSKYCHISLTDGSGIEFSFNIRPVPGEPAQLKCRCSGSNQVRLGETLPSDIQVSVQDATGNEIKKFEKGVLKDLSVMGDGLVVKETVRMLGQKSGFNIEGVRFESGQLGLRELKVIWRNLTDYVRLEMVAGPPIALQLQGWDVMQPVVVYNGTVLPQPLLAQLVDEAGNPTAEANVRVQLTRDAGIKLVPAPMPVKTDRNGLANFGVPAVSGKKGVYEIQAKAFIGRTTLLGPKLLISIQADFLKPVSLTVDYDKNVVYKAGEPLPDFTVKVFSEDETVMTSAKASHMSMRLRPVSARGDTSSARVMTLAPDTRKKVASDGNFLFTNRKVPQKAGTYHIMFVYDDHKHQVDSHEIAIKVHPGTPQSLVPAEMPGTPTVSNARSLASRTLIRSLTLELRDQFDNPCSNEFNGKVSLEIINSSSVAAAFEKPEFAGHTKRLTQTLTKGQIMLQNVVLEENTTGRDGQEYVLHCTIEAPALHRLGGPALTYDIPFLFYNDIKKQSQMAALSKERDNLRSAIKAYRSLFDTTQQLINELRISLNEAMQEETRLKAELRRQGLSAAQLVNVAAVDSLLAEKTREKDRLLHLPRRLCGLHPAQKDRDVLGKIAHLAEVSDPDIACVLSWHMSADMDCVVTLNTTKAQDIYKLSLGKQQVLPLDSIYKKNLPDWSKPLPHQRIRPTWNPSGNPVYARNMLHFPHDIDKCKIVFGMLLGDTIILDTISDANAYRHEIVKNTHCPTILTRQGDRIRSNGKFGGLMNKALPIEKLRGVVFAEPISPQYSTLCSLIDLLQSYKVAAVRRETSRVELGEQLQNQKTAEMTAKYKECSEAETQLGQIEGRLGMTPTSASPSQLPPSEPLAKRSRTSLSPSVSVNGTTPSTPTRQSLRRVALNASSERKRYRRT